MKILISEQDGDTRKRHAQQCGNEGDRSPVRLGSGKATARDPVTAQQQQKNGSKLPEQDRPWQGQMQQRAPRAQ